MLINVNIQAENTDELIQTLRALLAEQTDGKPASVPQKASEVPTGADTAADDADKPTRKKKTSKKKASKKKAAAKADTDLDDEDELGLDPELPSMEQMREAATRVNAAHGLEKVRELINEHGGKNISTIPDDNRAEFVAACEEAAS